MIYLLGTALNGLFCADVSLRNYSLTLSTRNALPDILKRSTHSLLTFRCHLKHSTSRSTSTPSAFEVITVNALYKLLSYSLTYLLSYWPSQ